MNKKLSLGIGRVKSDSNLFGFFDVVDRLIPGENLEINDQNTPRSFHPEITLVEDDRRYSKYLNHCPWVFDISPEGTLSIEALNADTSEAIEGDLAWARQVSDGNFWLILRLINIGEFPNVPELENYRLCIPFEDGKYKSNSGHLGDMYEKPNEVWRLSTVGPEQDPTGKQPEFKDAAWFDLFRDFSKQELLEQEMSEETLAKSLERKKQGGEYFSTFEADGDAHKLIRSANVARHKPFDAKEFKRIVELSKEFSADQDSECD
ncbi:hypothetical protein A3758_14425 [Oleiphilus sp. HI0118]|nr:hypothetical protein A3758_14425 [Oleiphilus sp. HI0118]